MDVTTQSVRYEIAHQDRQKHVDAIVCAGANKKLVVAGPGTGKTYLFRTVLEGKSKTLTLTFVKALVAELSLSLFGVSEVRTLHGYARSQLGRAVGKTSVRVFPMLSDVIAEDARILLAEEVDFDHLLHNRVPDDLHLGFYSRRRKYYDHFGFSDLIYAAVLYFELNKEKIPVYEQIVVDEFQDFNALEVSLIDLLATKSPVLLAGDDDQALYEELKSANAEYIRDRHAGGSEGYTSFTLPYCSRSTRVIVDAANDIIARAQDTGLLSRRIEKPFRYFEDEDRDKQSDDDPHIVHTYVFERKIPWFIAEQLKAITKQRREEFTVLVLAPTGAQCRRIYEALRAKGFEHVQFVERVHSDGPSLLDGLKLLLAERRCNLGWRIVAEKLLESKDFESLLRQTDGESKAKGIIDMIPPSLTREVRPMLTSLRRVRDQNAVLTDDALLALLGQIDIDAYGAARQALRDELVSMDDPKADAGIRGTSITVTTIQGSKGLDADYVFITNFDDRYCVRDKKGKASDQDVCRFLVALTRARRKVFLLSTDKDNTPTFLTWIDKHRIRET